ADGRLYRRLQADDGDHPPGLTLAPTAAQAAPARRRSGAGGVEALASRLGSNCTGTLRPSRRPLRGLFRMTFFFNAITKSRHPEEARSAVSKDTKEACDDR